MKRTIKFLSLALALTTLSLVSNANPGRGGRGSDGGLSIGGRIGASIYTLKSSAITEGSIFGYKTGITVAGVANYAFSDLFSIQPELAFVQKGAEFDFLGVNLGGETVNYIELPILAKVSFGPENFKFFINAGPSFGFAIGASFEDDEGNSESAKFDDTDGRKRFELGLAFGSGIGFMAGPGMLTIEGRYGLGLSPYAEDKDTDLLTGAEVTNTIKNIGYMFSVGYLIPLQ